MTFIIYSRAGGARTIDNRCAASYSQKSLLNKVRDTEGVKYSICTNH